MASNPIRCCSTTATASSPTVGNCSAAARRAVAGRCRRGWRPDAMLGSYAGITRVFRNDGSGGVHRRRPVADGRVRPRGRAGRLADFDGDLDLDAWTGLCCSGGVRYRRPGRSDLVERRRRHFRRQRPVARQRGHHGERRRRRRRRRRPRRRRLDLPLALLARNQSRLLERRRRPAHPGASVAGHRQPHRRRRRTARRWRCAPDLFFVVRGAGSKVWLNDGAGTFADTGQALGGANAYAVALGDSTATATATPSSATTAPTPSGSTTARGPSSTPARRSARPTRPTSTCSTPTATATSTPGRRPAVASRRSRTRSG